MALRLGWSNSGLIELGSYAEWSDAERLAAHVMRFYQECAGADATVDYVVAFQRMAELYDAEQA